LGWHPAERRRVSAAPWRARDGGPTTPYLDALAVVDDQALAYRALDQLTQPVRKTHLSLPEVS